MRAIPARTLPLRRVTMPAITSTAAMIHKMVSVLPPRFAASIPRAPNMSPPLILWSSSGNIIGGAHWQQYGGRRSVAHSMTLRPFPTDGAPSGKPQAYEIPRWVPALGESVRNRPEVTPKTHVAAVPLTFD